MPFVNIQMLTGKTVEQKAALAKAITDAFVEIAQSKPEAVAVIFTDLQKTDLAKAGKLVSEL
ncbi:MAG: tautomerase family protein [Negativicutes bacterium]|nr:tautomerase family protein [Negativicutes bacterium]